jgi:hypothetical protein
MMRVISRAELVSNGNALAATVVVFFSGKAKKMFNIQIGRAHV